MDSNAFKTLFALVASGLGGFYLGGRYVGQEAIQTYRMSKPAWLTEVQSTLMVALIGCGVAAAVWILMDYRE